MQDRFAYRGKIPCLCCLLVFSNVFAQAQTTRSVPSSRPAPTAANAHPANQRNSNATTNTKLGAGTGSLKLGFPWSHPKASAQPNTTARPAATLNRAGLPGFAPHPAGINQRPLPSGRVMLRPDGNRILSSTGGRNYLVRADGSVAIYARGETRATFGENGAFRSLHTANMDIHHGPHGDVRVVSVRPDGVRIVSFGSHSGYVERPMAGGFVQRTYLEGGRSHVRIYRTYIYRGVIMRQYVPSVRYEPAFYGWAARPWSAPVVYAWGWNTQPWYGYGAAVFTPYPVYTSPSLWLTDYLLAANLQSAYAQQAAPVASGNVAQQFSGGPVPAAPGETPAQTNGSEAPTPISPEFKQLIDEEVAQQLASEQAAPGTPSATAPVTTTPNQAPVALDPNVRVFLVSSPIEVTSGGTPCTLSAGDALFLPRPVPDQSTEATVLVTSSAKSDCATNAEVKVAISDLQEMHNDFAAHMDDGLNVLASQQGTHGIPSAPGAVPQSSAIQLASSPDPAALDSAIQQQRQEAAQTENQVQQEALASAGN